MNGLQLLQVCLRSIFRNRMRSLLTSLGIVIGVGSVIVTVALGEGSRQEIERGIKTMGTNLLQIMPQTRMNRTGNQVFARAGSFTQADLAKLKAESSFAAAISGVVNVNSNIVGPVGNAQVQVQGVEPDFLAIRNHVVESGSFFGEDDLSGRSRVAVLGPTTAATLFGNPEDALQQRIRIGNTYFTIIGLLRAKGMALGGMDQDNVVLVPLTTAMTRLGNSRNVGMIVMSVAEERHMTAAGNEAKLILAESRRIPNPENADFDIMNQSDLIDMASATSKTLTTLLSAIAGVSLLVGGIGIMNIMLVSVTERTREIGIRMAIGARKRDILFQFLCEAVILSLLGGLLGIALAFLAGHVLSLAGIPSAINPLIVLVSALFAAGVGVVFGYYPAMKAAGLYPIDALRYE